MAINNANNHQPQHTSSDKQPEIQALEHQSAVGTKALVRTIFCVSITLYA